MTCRSIGPSVAARPAQRLPEPRSGLERALRCIETPHLTVHRGLNRPAEEQALQPAEVGAQRERNLCPAPGRREPELAAWPRRPGDDPECVAARRLVGGHLDIGGDSATHRALDDLVDSATDTRR